jgi:hypothetical protein
MTSTLSLLEKPVKSGNLGFHVVKTNILVRNVIANHNSKRDRGPMHTFFGHVVNQFDIPV